VWGRFLAIVAVSRLRLVSYGASLAVHPAGAGIRGGAAGVWWTVPEGRGRWRSGRGGGSCRRWRCGRRCRSGDQRCPEARELPETAVRAGWRLLSAATVRPEPASRRSVEVVEGFREAQPWYLGHGRGRHPCREVGPAVPGGQVADGVLQDHPHRDLAGDLVAYAPVVGQRGDDVQPPAAARGHRGRGRCRAGRAAAVGDLDDEPAAGVDAPGGPYVAVAREGVAEGSAVLARVAQQLGKD